MQKNIDTCILKYGVENIMQTGLFYTTYQYKDYILPSGKTIKVQGYENFLLDELLLQYNENEIVTERENMPEIWYYSNNRKKRYFPDVYIPSAEILYEVKSVYTLNKSKIDGIFEKKRKAVLDSGYKFILKVY